MRSAPIVPAAPSILIILPQGLVVSGVTTWAMRLVDGLARHDEANTRNRCTAILSHRNPDDQQKIDAGKCARDTEARIIATDLEPMDRAATDLSRAIDVYGDAVRRLNHSSGDDRNRTTILVPNLHHDCFAAAAALQEADPQHIRLVGWCHRDDPYDLALLRHYEPALTSFVAVSENLGRRLRESIPSRAGDVAVRPYAVPMASEVPARDPMLDGGGKRVRPIRLLYTGRMEEPQKRVSDLMRVARRLCELSVPFEMTLVGDGPAARTIDAMVQADDATSRALPVRRLSAIQPDGVERLLHESDVFVLASKFEGRSVAMSEAMGAGCVPVVTAVSAVDELVRDGVNGFTIEVGDTQAMAKRIAELAADDDLLSRMRAAAWRTIRESAGTLEEYAEFAAALLDHAARRPSRRMPPARALTMPVCGGGIDQFKRACDRFLSIAHQCRDGRIAVWGTGRHTEAILSSISSRPRIACFIDDDPARHGSTHFGAPVISPAAVGGHRITDVIISSSLYEVAIYERRREVAPARVHRLYGVPESTEHRLAARSLESIV